VKTTAAAPKNSDEYIAGFPPRVRAVLRRVRSAIRKAIPGAEEAISYQTPTYKLNGRPVIYFSGWKEHYSLYPADTRVIAAFEKQLTHYDYNGKGTLRFPLNEPVPETLIAAIAKFRAKDVAAKQTTATRHSRSHGSIRRKDTHLR
jgi:uncharacterized protein YdhG (YjbR/CyaY superfamily)